MSPLFCIFIFLTYSQVVLTIETSSNDARFGEHVKETVRYSLLKLDIVREKSVNLEIIYRRTDELLKGIATISVLAYLLTLYSRLVIHPVLLSSLKLAGLISVACSICLKYYVGNHIHLIANEFNFEIDSLVENLFSYYDTSRNIKLYRRVKYLQRILTENEFDFDLKIQKDVKVLFKVDSNENVFQAINNFFSQRWSNLNVFANEFKDLAKKYLNSDDTELMRNSLSIYLVLEGLRTNNFHLAEVFQFNIIQSIINDVSLVLQSSSNS